MKIKLQAKRLLDADQECRFDGTITINMPLHHERTRMMIEGIGTISQDDMKKDGDQSIERARTLGEAAALVSEKVFGLIIDCDLKSDEGEKIVDKETLWAHPDAMPLVEGLVGRFMTNFAGNKNAP